MVHFQSCNIAVQLREKFVKKAFFIFLAIAPIPLLLGLGVLVAIAGMAIVPCYFDANRSRRAAEILRLRRIPVRVRTSIVIGDKRVPRRRGAFYFLFLMILSNTYYFSCNILCSIWLKKLLCILTHSCTHIRE